jgi:endonuclease/exonuclease/phosphatase (EEP) superfamily protein YafD
MTIRSAVTLVALATLTGCAVVDESANRLAGDVHTDPLACGSQLVGSSRSEQGELDSSDIRMVNWNIQKGGDPQWTTDLATFQSDPDLMIFQEAPLNSNAWDVVSVDQYLSFSPGYRTSRALTGVMTVSAVKPLTQCNFVSVEPWLRSPKATVITEYGLTGTDQTLVVVNIHAMNFTFGAHAFVWRSCFSAADSASIIRPGESRGPYSAIRRFQHLEREALQDLERNNGQSRP